MKCLRQTCSFSPGLRKFVFLLPLLLLALSLGLPLLGLLFRHRVLPRHAAAPGPERLLFRCLFFLRTLLLALLFPTPRKLIRLKVLAGFSS